MRINPYRFNKMWQTVFEGNGACLKWVIQLFIELVVSVSIELLPQLLLMKFYFLIVEIDKKR